MKGLLSMKRALKRREEKKEWLIHRIQSHQLILLRGEKSEYELEKIERYIKDFLMIELSEVEKEIRNYKLKIEKYQER